MWRWKERKTGGRKEKKRIKKNFLMKKELRKEKERQEMEKKERKKERKKENPDWSHNKWKEKPSSERITQGKGRREEEIKIRKKWEKERFEGKEDKEGKEKY